MEKTKINNFLFELQSLGYSFSNNHNQDVYDIWLHNENVAIISFEETKIRPFVIKEKNRKRFETDGIVELILEYNDRMLEEH